MKEREKEREKEGEWVYMAEMDDYRWTGDNEPVYFDDNPEYESPTEEERQQYREQEEIWMKANIEEEKQRKKEKRQQKEQERREAMRKPIDPLPVQEMCKYELIREDIIKERNEAMAQSNFFENLLEAKQEMTPKKAVKDKK